MDESLSYNRWEANRELEKVTNREFGEKGDRGRRWTVARGVDSASVGFHLVIVPAKGLSLGWRRLEPISIGRPHGVDESGREKANIAIRFD